MKQFLKFFTHCGHVCDQMCAKVFSIRCQKKGVMQKLIFKADDKSLHLRTKEGAISINENCSSKWCKNQPCKHDIFFLVTTKIQENTSVNVQHESVHYNRVLIVEWLKSWVRNAHTCSVGQVKKKKAPNAVLFTAPFPLYQFCKGVIIQHGRLVKIPAVSCAQWEHF